MSKKYKFLRTIAIILFTVFLITQINISTIQNKHAMEQTDRVYKIGVNEEKPYFYINENGEYQGYYNELITHISKKLNFKFEYIVDSYENILNKLELNEVDLAIGIYYTKERNDKFIYLDYPVIEDESSIYVNDRSIKYINDLSEKKIALTKSSVSTDWIIKLMRDRNIKADIVYVDNTKEAKQMLKNNEVDATFLTMFDYDIIGYKKVHSSYVNYAYLIGNQESVQLIDKISKLFEEYDKKILTPIDLLFTKYFVLYSFQGIKLLKLLLILFFATLILFWSTIKLNIFSSLNQIRKRNKINTRIERNNYLLYYQPIVNPIRKKIVGFEALIRLNDNGKIIAPNVFLQEIKDCDMMSRLSLWIFEKVLQDYTKIKVSEKFGEDFYVSINISLKEIENTDVLKKIKNIYERYNVESKYICFEITEDEKGHNLDIVRKNIDNLRKLGFKVAIDDFGTEYSNFSVLERFNFDIVKLDKYFIDDIENTPIKKATIRTFNRFVHETDKIIVIEGVEEEGQIEYLKTLHSTRINIQGYYYCKPIEITKLLDFKL